MMNKTIFVYLAMIGLLWACSSTPTNQISPNNGSLSARTDEETETIAVPIEQHSVQLVHPADKSPQSADLQSWWDSLPKPLQSQIKSKQVSVQLISSTKTILPNGSEKVDMKISETTKELERIIGSSAEMSITTTVFEQPQDQLLAAETTTSIQLAKKMPVKLSDFSSQIFLRRGDVSAENIQSLQYWWLNLPQDLQDKIKRREMLVDIACYTVDKGDLDIHAPRHLAADAENHAIILADALNEMVGTYKVGNKIMPLAKVETKALIEKSNNKNINYPAAQYIMIQLHTQREEASLPSL